MDELAHQDVAAAAAVHTELGQAYDGAVAEGLVERISSEIDKQVDARLAQHGIQPASRSAWRTSPWAWARSGWASAPPR